MKWNYKRLEFQEGESSRSYFSDEDWNFLISFNIEKKYIEENKFLLKSLPIFICDDLRKEIKESYSSIFEYYYSKISNSNKDFFLFTLDKKEGKFKKNELKWKEVAQINEWIEEKNSTASFNKKNLKISPYFFQEMYLLYKDNGNDSSYIKDLRNFHSLLLLSDKILSENEILTVSFSNQEEEYGQDTKLVIDSVENQINDNFFSIINWIVDEDDDATVRLKLEVAKLYLSSVKDIEKFNSENVNESEIEYELKNLLAVILNRKSRKYYEYENLKNEQYMKFIEQTNTLRNETNKKLLNLFILIPVALYGIYLSAIQGTTIFNLLDINYLFIYIVFLIAAGFILVVLHNDIKNINKGLTTILYSINRTYKTKMSEEHLEEQKLKSRDFRLQIISLYSFILGMIIMIFLLLCNINYQSIFEFILKTYLRIWMS